MLTAVSGEIRKLTVTTAGHRMRSKMRKGQLVQAQGYQMQKPEENAEVWPSWLVEGTHRIVETKKTLFGLLVRTDKQNQKARAEKAPLPWIHRDWFR